MNLQKGERSIMRILVIGGSSFLGVYTVDELLRRGIEVVATGRNPRFAGYYAAKGVPYIPLDICDAAAFSALDAYAFDAAVSFAAMMPANVEKDVQEEDIEQYMQVNVQGVLHILEYCRTHGIHRLVDIISRFDVRCYDASAVITEETPLRFSYLDDHAAYVVSNNTKAEMMHYYNERHGMDNIWLRIPSIYGVGPHGSFCKDGVYKKSGLQIFMDKASAGETIEVFGDPDTPKDVLYVKDMAHAVAQALTAPAAKGLYNISYDRNFTLREIAQAVADAFAGEKGHSQVVLRQDVQNNGGFPQMSNEKARRELGFAPTYTTALAMMQDYKKELDRGVYGALFERHV